MIVKMWRVGYAEEKTQPVPILTSCIHWTPLVPMATMEKPMVAPTMQ